MGPGVSGPQIAKGGSRGHQKPAKIEVFWSKRLLLGHVTGIDEEGRAARSKKSCTHDRVRHSLAEWQESLGVTQWRSAIRRRRGVPGRWLAAFSTR